MHELESAPHSHPPAPEPDDNTAALRGLSARTVLMVSIAVGIGWLLVSTRAALVLIYLSALLAVGLAPLVSHLERRPPPFHFRPSRVVATAFVYLTGTAIFVIALVVVVPTIVTQARDFALFAPKALARLQEWLLARGVLRHTVTVEELLSNAPAGSDTLGVVFDTFFGLVGGVVGWVTMLMLSFYFLIEAQTMFESLIRFVPKGRRAHVNGLHAGLPEDGRAGIPLRLRYNSGCANAGA